MKIAVIGAGITGISTAYELVSHGHHVTVFEKSNAAAEGASFAPNGLIAPSMIQPLALCASDPNTWSRFAKNAKPFSLRSGLRWSDMQWLWQWNKHGNTESLASTIQNLRSLYTYSQERMRTIASHANFEYEQSMGQLVVLRTAEDENLLQPRLNFLKECGIEFQVLNHAQCIKYEPALSLSTEFHAGIHFPHDEVANCRQFAMLLKAELQQKNVDFQFSTKVKQIVATPRLAIALEGESEASYFDHIVLCAGPDTPALLHPLQCNFASTVVCNYSLTLPIRETTLAPRSAVLDTKTNMTLHRLGQRIRVCGGYELGAKVSHKHKKTMHQMYQVMEQFFPGAALHQAGSLLFKSGQLMTTNGLPFIGTSRIAGLWVNAGHGVHGWGTACGSAKLIADLITKIDPEIDGLAFQR